MLFIQPIVKGYQLVRYITFMTYSGIRTKPSLMAFINLCNGFECFEHDSIFTVI